eukprot:SAG31_NODE_564_length_14059_cov_5.728940_8_plen_497_part_00
MVQDTQEPEFYCARYRHRNPMTGEEYVTTSKYLDEIPPQSELLEEMDLRERTPFYCVPIPAETPWAKTKCAGLSTTSIASTCQDAAGGDVCSTKQKRSAASGDEIEPFEQPSPPRSRPNTAGVSATAAANLDSATGPEAMDTCSGTENQSNSRVIPQWGLDTNFPLSCEPGPAVLVKVYDGDGDAIKLNGTFEFVGVLAPVASTNFEFQAAGGAADDGFRSGGLEHNMASSQLPRLHSVLHRQVAGIDTLLDPTAGVELPMVMQQLAFEIPALRAGFIDAAASVLGGDTLAAEYLLLHCISHVYHRVADVCVGRFCLNLQLSGATSTAKLDTDSLENSAAVAQAVYQLLSESLPAVFMFGMTPVLLNKATMVPSKDYDLNRLRAGMLQLSDGTELVVDETVMCEGQLNEKGTRNVRALQELIETGSVQYDFGSYANVTMPHDIPVLTISHCKSLLPVHPIFTYFNILLPLCKPAQRALMCACAVFSAFVHCGLRHR